MNIALHCLEQIPAEKKLARIVQRRTFFVLIILHLLESCRNVQLETRYQHISKQSSVYAHGTSCFMQDSFGHGPGPHEMQ